MVSTEYNLYYFDIRGLGEPIRYLLSYGEANWKDHRLPYVCFGKSELPEDVKHRCPYGQVPLLEFDGHQLAQSATIGRFLAKKFKLTGKDEVEAAKCDEVVDAVKDFFSLYTPIFHAEDSSNIAGMLEKTVATAKERFLGKFNQTIKTNGGHIVGKSLTWADIWVAHFVSNLQMVSPNVSLTEDFPALRSLIHTVFNEPRIKKWIEERPESPY